MALNDDPVLANQNILIYFSLFYFRTPFGPTLHLQFCWDDVCKIVTLPILHLVLPPTSFTDI